MVREIAAVFEWAFGRPAGVSTYPDGGDGRRGGPTLVFIRGVLQLAGERIPAVEPGREALAAALLKLAKRPYGVDDRVKKLPETNDGSSETKCG